MHETDFRQRTYRPQHQTADTAAVHRPSQAVEPTPLISAIVVFWEQSPPFGTCLQRLRLAGHRLDDALEIIVVDNGHHGGLDDILHGLWDQWIELPDNRGPGYARNVGARAAEAPLVAFVDEDALVSEDYLENTLTYFQDPDVVGIRGRIRHRNHPLFTTLATHYDQGDERIDDALITEGASIVRRTPFVDAGGFPLDVDGHEGIELTHRLRQVQPEAKTVYAPDVMLHHDYLEGWDDFFKKSTRHARNEVELQQRDPDAAEFLQDYFQRSFPSRQLPPHTALARLGLRALRTALQTLTRLRAQLQRIRQP